MSALRSARRALRFLRRLLSRMRYEVLGRMLDNTAPANTAYATTSHIHNDDSFKQLSFTFALIALSARVACVEGNVSMEKYIAFRESFPLRGGMCRKLRELFTLACTDNTPLEHYAQQLRNLYPNTRELCNSVCERLFRIATADGSLSPKEELLLTDIGHLLGIEPATFATLRDRFQNPTKADLVFGISGDVSPSTLKKRYHELMRRYHPDRFAMEEMSPELRLLLKLKTSEINEAYRQLSGKRD